MTEYEINSLIALGFGFGSVFWSITLWIVFGRR